MTGKVKINCKKVVICIIGVFNVRASVFYRSARVSFKNSALIRSTIYVEFCTFADCLEKSTKILKTK